MKIRLSDLLEGCSEAIITMWHVSESEKISKGQDIFEVSTDKATFDVVSPCGGRLAKIMKAEGESVIPDDIIAEVIEDV